MCRAAHAACAADALSLGTKGDLRQGLSSTLPPIHPRDVLVSMTACGRLMSHPQVYDCSADLFVFSIFKSAEGFLHPGKGPDQALTIRAACVGATMVGY